MAFIKTMKAMDFNILMSIISMIKSSVPTHLTNYGLGNTNVDVSPTYPRNMTEFVKPSIIIQKIGTDESKISTDGFMGQAFDSETNTYYDVFGKRYNTIYQFDVAHNSKEQSMLLTSLVCDEIVGGINNEHAIYDYTQSLTDPPSIGTFKILSDYDTIPLLSTDQEFIKHENNDYVIAVRCNICAIQTIVPAQEYIDLSKLTKVTQKINRR